jgi:hypothetical protein
VELRFLRLFEINGREILRKQKIIYTQSITERACKSSADQNIEPRIFEKLLDPFPAYLFSDAGMNDFNCAIINRSTNYADTIPISA